MRIREGDSVAINGDPKDIGVVERRKGGALVVRVPVRGNLRESILRKEAKPLAEMISDARASGSKLKNGLSLTGASKLQELVELFGYTASQRLRSDSLDRVVNQLQRAGLTLNCSTDLWGREDSFWVEPAAEADRAVEQESDEGQDSDDDSVPEVGEDYTGMSLPDPFWPTAFGLSRKRELALLRGLTLREPLLCILRLPDAGDSQGWLRPTWEGILTWAYLAAQRFDQAHVIQNLMPTVVRGDAGFLQAYLVPSVLSSESAVLSDRANSLNLVVIKSESEMPTEYERLKAIWPGPVFEFSPTWATASDGVAPVEVAALVRLLMMVGGHSIPSAAKIGPGTSPLQALLWAKEAATDLLAKAAAEFGAFVAEREPKKFKGSNEGASALSLKAYVAQWVQRHHPKSKVEFEEVTDSFTDGDGVAREETRADVTVKDIGVFEIESLVGSGPMEAFIHRKVYSRLKKSRSLFLVLPADALLWAGPHFSDLAHRAYENNGHVLFPGAGASFLRLANKTSFIEANSAEIEIPRLAELASARVGRGGTSIEAADAVKLEDVVGYPDVHELIKDRIIFQVEHRTRLPGLSRTSAILFFGPPGCGKSRFARAVAGTLGHEVRLLGPSDLRGEFVGWGQRKIHQEFDWLVGGTSRMLVIDEIDAVGRSRRQDGNMHTDEMADVNELLHKMDQASLLGRLVVGTTNYVDSLDDALVRSGRFGLKVPVPPPDVEAAVSITRYYLNKIKPKSETGSSPSSPTDAELRQLFKETLISEEPEAGHYCGADLEAVVEAAVLKKAQGMVRADPTSRRSELVVELTVTDLKGALASAPRSINADAMEQFRADLRRHCDSTRAKAILEAFPKGR